MTILGLRFRKGKQCLPIALQEIGASASSGSSSGTAYTDPIPLSDFSRLSVQDPSTSDKHGGVYQRLLKRNKKEGVAANAAEKDSKKKSLKNYLPDRDATIGAITLAATIGRDIGDATNIGYLKGLAGLVLLIIETTEGVKTCKSEVERLSRHIVELICALINEQETKGSHPSHETMYHITSLQGKLSKIHKKLQDMKKGNYWTRLARQAEDNADIVRFNKDIKHYLRLFGIQQDIQLNAKLAHHQTQQAEHQSSIISIFSSGHRKQMTEIKRVMSGDTTSVRGTIPERDDSSTSIRPQLTDSVMTAEPEAMDDDSQYTGYTDVDMEDAGTLKGGNDDTGFGHCLPPDNKMHFGREDVIERIAQMLVECQRRLLDTIWDTEEVLSDTLSDTDPFLERTPSVTQSGSSSIWSRGTPVLPHTPLPSRSGSFFNDPFTMLPGSPASSVFSIPSTPPSTAASLIGSRPGSPSLPWLANTSPKSDQLAALSSGSDSRSQFSAPFNAGLPTSASSALRRQSSLASSVTAFSLGSVTPPRRNVNGPSPFSIPNSSHSPSFSPFTLPTPTPNRPPSVTSTNPSHSQMRKPTRSNTMSSDHSTRSFGSSSPLLTRARTPSTMTFTSESQFSNFSRTMNHSNSAARIAILGPKGIGKSSVITRALHVPAVEDMFGDRRIFVDCQEDGDATAVLRKIMQTMGVEELMQADNDTDLTTQLIKHLSQPSPDLHQVCKKPSMASSLVSSVSCSSYLPPTNRDTRRLPPTVLVLDGLETAWNPHATRPAVENLLTSIASLSHIALVITMDAYERPLQVQWTRPCLKPIEPLCFEDALRVFNSIADLEGVDGVREVVESCGGMPARLVALAQEAQYSFPSVRSRVVQQRLAAYSARQFTADIEHHGWGLRSDLGRSF